MTAPRYNEDLIAIIDERIKASQLKVMDFGTVQDRDTTGPFATVVFDGTADAAPVKVPGHVHCFGGDRVVLQKIKGTWVVMGTFNRRQLQDATGRSVGPASPGTSTSTTNVDQPVGLSVLFSKRYDLTAIRISLETGAYVTGATGTVIATAVRIAGAPGTATAASFTPQELNMGVMAFAALNTHLAIPGWSRTAAVPAGDFVLTPRWRRFVGTGTMVQDSNDQIILDAYEIFRETEV